MRLSEISWAEQDGLYGDIDREEFLAIDFSGSRSAFVLARIADRAVGCGAILPLRVDAGEVRRMFVAPEVRGLGIGGKILAVLESRALQMGYATLQLATGIRQPGAVRLYEKAGYQRIGRYGRYCEKPLLICFSKTLGGTHCHR